MSASVEDECGVGVVLNSFTINKTMEQAIMPTAGVCVHLKSHSCYLAFTILCILDHGAYSLI
jgi:hypothetical protein